MKVVGYRKSLVDIEYDQQIGRCLRVFPNPSFLVVGAGASGKSRFNLFKVWDPRTFASGFSLPRETWDKKYREEKYRKASSTGIKTNNKLLDYLCKFWKAGSGLLSSNSELGTYVESCKSTTSSIIEIRDELRILYAGYARTKDKAILSYIKSLIRLLDKSKVKKLKKLFLASRPPKKKLPPIGFTDHRKKIRSLIYFGTTLYTSVTGCEENSYFAISRENEYYSSNYQKRCVCTTKTNKLNQLISL